MTTGPHTRRRGTRGTRGRQAAAAPLAEDHQHLDDTQLRSLLRAADPAGALPPATPAHLAHLLDNTMAPTSTPPTDTTDPSADASGGTDPAGTSHDADAAQAEAALIDRHSWQRTPLTWLVAAAAVTAIAVGSGWILTSHDTDTRSPAVAATSPAGPETTAATEDAAPTVVRAMTLTMNPAAAAGKCMAPSESPQVVAAQQVAFDGVVTSISGSTVALKPTRYYTPATATSPHAGVVKVEAPSATMAALLSAVQFREGQRYLVSATDKTVTLCGFTAPYSPQLADTYAQAFPTTS